MTETAREVFSEYLDMADGDPRNALWFASHEIAAMSKSVSAGYVRATPEKRKPMIKPKTPSLDDGEAWLETGVTDD